MLGINRKTDPDSMSRAQKEVDRIQALIDRAGGIVPYMTGAAAFKTEKTKRRKENENNG